MELRQLGTTGMRVSELGLGTMTWGRDTDEIDAAEQFRDFLDAGGTLIDTSASYADGASEEVVGSLLAEVRREDVVLCTKAGVRSTSRGNVLDASRGAVPGSLDASLQRLGTDHVDLFLVQNPDPRTPLDETLSALQRAVDSGRARYVGLSNHPAWQQARAATLLQQAGLAVLDAVGVTGVRAGLKWPNDVLACPPDLGKLIDLPLAIAVDVVLSPLYLIGLVALSISMG